MHRTELETLRREVADSGYPVGTGPFVIKRIGPEMHTDMVRFIAMLGDSVETDRDDEEEGD